MRRPRLAQLVSCFVTLFTLGISAWVPATAQVLSQTGDTPEVPRIASRVVQRVDDSRIVRLAGNTHPMARREFDRGAVAATLPMERMVLILKRSPEQEASLTKFMADQLDPKSPNFHHWLQPEEFGALYGPSQYDIQAVTNWLQNQGFSVDNVTKGRMFIEFSGNAAQVQTAFHTEIHRFNVDGEEHIANASDPQIPEALAPVVHGIMSLHNFQAKPQHKYLGDFQRIGKTDKWTPLNPEIVNKPLFTVPGASPAFELISPYDFATIYNLTPLWNAGIDGTGQTIAIAGRTDISLADVQKFRSNFGLPVNNPVFVLNGADPGVASEGDKVENTLDVEWSGAAAPKATIKFVITKSTNTSDGASASALYIIDNNVAKIMSFSYGNCELAYGTSGNTFNNQLWQQAAAQGISAFVASGDQGSAACDGGGTAPYGASNGLAVSGASTTPYNIAVGGTDFNWLNLTKSYWSSTNNATTKASALSYIPEIPWNGTCASTSLDQAIGATAAGYDAEQTCQYELNNNFDLQFVTVAGGTGGKSACTTPSGTTPSTCSGGYAKPSWQTGVGVPADGKRDVPDVSLFAASGAMNDAYVICDSQTNPCTYTDSTTALTQAVGGTSVASPAMAGIMALINQKMGSAQGNANPAFYALAAKDNRSSCNSVSVAGGNTCNFYDITTDNNAVPCVPGSLNCTVSHSGDGVGILNGYKSTTGYDLATGLGSVNAYNLVNNFSSVVTTPAPAVTLSPTSVAFASTTVGSTSATSIITIKNSGTAALTLTSETITGTNATSFIKSATTCTTSLAAGATCTVSVQFKPTVAGSLSASLAIADNAKGSPQTVALTGTATAASTLTVTLSPASLSFGSVTVNATSAAQVITIKNTGTAAVAFTSYTFTGTNASAFAISTRTCSTSLAAGASCTLSIVFKPTATGAQTATFNATDNATGSPQKVALSGTGTASSTGALTVSPTSIAFPATITGTTSDAQIVTLTNTSTATVTISSVALGGTNPTSFIEINSCAATLAANTSCSLYVAFKPAAAGALTGTISITDNATGSPQKVTLTGTGTAAPSVKLSATSIAFPTTKSGTTSAAKAVTLTNSGTATLNLTSIALTGSSPTSFVALDTCGATLAPSASCTVYVAFAPKATGSVSASLAIADNGAASPQTVALTGTGN